MSLVVANISGLIDQEFRTSTDYCCFRIKISSTSGKFLYVKVTNYFDTVKSLPLKIFAGYWGPLYAGVPKLSTDLNNPSWHTRELYKDYPGLVCCSFCNFAPVCL